MTISEGRTYKGEGREFTAGELFAGARSGRFTLRPADGGGMYVTIVSEDETVKVVPR